MNCRFTWSERCCLTHSGIPFMLGTSILVESVSKREVPLTLP